jgi:hypothetical protein
MPKKQTKKPEASKPSAPIIKTLSLDDLTPADYNPRTISDDALDGLRKSIERFDLVQPIIWNERTKRIVGGHQRVKAMRQLGRTEAQVVVVDLPETEEKALNIALNSPAIAGEFTDDLQALLGELAQEDEALFEDLRLGELVIEVEEEAALSENYTRKIEIPHYTPKGERPLFSDCVNDSKTLSLLAMIEAQDLDPEMAAFLRLAAYRHASFRYDKIAELYCHQTPEIQALFEESALVLIDFDRALESGFVRLTKGLTEIVGGGEDA